MTRENDEMILWVLEQLEKSNIKDEFMNCQKQSLIRYHGTIGRAIRNEFKLWKNKWTPEIVDNVDVSKNHPDAISMNIIENAWEALHDNN